MEKVIIKAFEQKNHIEKEIETHIFKHNIWSDDYNGVEFSATFETSTTKKRATTRINPPEYNCSCKCVNVEYVMYKGEEITDKYAQLIEQLIKEEFVY